MIEYQSSTGEIVIADEAVGFADVFEAVQATGKALRVDDGFLFDCSLRLTDNARLSDRNVAVTITGEKFQIEKGCSLTLGTYTNGVAGDGCYVRMDNVLQRYGFGEDTLTNDQTQSGHVFLYNSMLKIPGFWGFFSGQDQRVEIVDCIINGYGRIEGPDSFIKNVTFEQAHPRFGVLSPKGQLAAYEDIHVRESAGAAYYFNGELADDLRIVGGSAQNYRQLVYCERHDHGMKTIRFVDVRLDGGRKVKFNRNNTVEIAHSFTPSFVDADGVPFVDVPVTVYNDKDEDAVFVGRTDVKGRVHGELVIWRNSDSTSAEDLGPFIVVLGLPDGDVKVCMDVDRKIDGPFVLLAGALVPVDGGDGSGGDTDTPVLTPKRPNEGASHGLYVCSPNHDLNEIQKDRVINVIGETYSQLDVYTDQARSAYDRTFSYEQLMLNVAAGLIERLYVWEWEVLGTHRMALARKLLEHAGVEVVVVKELA